MNAHIYSKIHNITNYRNPLLDDIVRFLYNINVYFCLPKYYELSFEFRKLQKNIVLNRAAICAHLHFECITATVVFFHPRLYEQWERNVPLPHHLNVPAYGTQLPGREGEAVFKTQSVSYGLTHHQSYRLPPSGSLPVHSCNFLRMTLRPT